MTVACYYNAIALVVVMEAGFYTCELIVWCWKTAKKIGLPWNSWVYGERSGLAGTSNATALESDPKIMLVNGFVVVLRNAVRMPLKRWCGGPLFAWLRRSTSSARNFNTNRYFDGKLDYQMHAVMNCVPNGIFSYRTKWWFSNRFGGGGVGMQIAGQTYNPCHGGDLRTKRIEKRPCEWDNWQKKKPSEE